MRFRFILRSWLALPVALALAAGEASAQSHPPPLPVPCIAGTCGSNGPSSWVSSGSATAVQSGKSLTINQSTQQAILNWSSFNIAAGNKVQFQQPSATAIALNKIYQASPSSILGQLSANGQIYLINQNGFIFGSSAVVNTAGLIASSLDMSAATFNAGILSPLQNNGAPALQSDGRSGVEDLSGNLVLGANGQPQPVQVVVQPGAQLNVANGGRLLLAGQNVLNGGTLQAPNGQIVLAAGQSVYLEASQDPTLRGLIVEVDGGGKAANQLTGVLTATTGNISLVGLAVNQDGRVSATTTVNANGSIRLEAADTVVIGGGQGAYTVTATNGGTAELGSASSTNVLPDLSDTTTAVPSQTQNPSTVTISGEQVLMHGGQIVAPGGTLDVSAVANPSAGLTTDGNAAARIRIDAGTNIDLAGSDSTLPMSANLVSFQLRSNELKDDPDQRNGALHGQTIVADIRDPKPPIVSASSWTAELAAVEQTVAQRTSVGGSAKFESEGDIVVANGASINVSGGTTTYQGGTVQTSELVGANGQLYNIETANPLLTYRGVLNPTFTQTYNRWGVQITEPTPGLGHYESGYVQGSSAGSVQFAAPVMALNGTLTGKAVNGPLQRTASTMALGGLLEIGDPTLGIQGNALYPDFFSPAVTFVNRAPGLTIQDSAALLPQPLALPVSYITSGGFTRTTVYGDSSVTLAAGVPLNLGVGGSLSVQAPVIDVLSSVAAPSGTINLQSTPTATYQNPALPRTGITIGDAVSLDVSGEWTNDTLNPAAAAGPALTNAGGIDLALTALSGSALILGDDSSLKANGGAWLSASGQVTAGSGGSITISAAPYQSALAIGKDTSLSAFGVDSANGGSLALTAPRILLTNGNGSQWAPAQTVDDLRAPGGVIRVDAPLFSQYGFSSISLTAAAPVASMAKSDDVLTVAAGTTINALTETWQLASGFNSKPSVATVASFISPVLEPEALRPVTKVALRVTPGFENIVPNDPIGNLDIQAGASITAQPGLSNGSIIGGTIALSGYNDITIGGVLRAPGGNISASLFASPLLNQPDFPTQLLELGAGGILDASGTLVPNPNVAGLQLGTVLGGGTVSLTGTTGAVVAAPGSQIDIAGSSAPLQVQSMGSSGGYTSATVASAGGSLSVESSASISLLGGLTAAAGAGSLGKLQAGALSVSLVDLTPQQAYPANPLTIDIVASTVGTAAPTLTSGEALLGVTQLGKSGIDSLTLSADDIAINTNMPLALGRQLTLDSQDLTIGNGTTARLSAPYVAMGYGLQGLPGVPVNSGTGTLNVSAQQLTLYGLSAVQGAHSVTLTSAGDVQLEPIIQGGLYALGGLTMTGNLTINAARVYPSTDTTFTIKALGDGNTVSIGQSAASPGTPLSVGGSLTINADNIVSSGTLIAPFGNIALNANTSLTLAKGSVTSVSADGMVLPYGQTNLGGEQWIYAAAGVANAAAPLTGIPVPRISLTAPKVNFASGATVDLKGGGDLQAYEWVPGTGGSVDALAAGTVPGLYAVLPGVTGAAAPYDLQESTQATITAGQSVYLSGIAGLASGTYALLPARYALLPGAYLIQLEPGYTSAHAGQIGALGDGTPVVAGYLSTASTGLQRSSGYTGFAVWPGSYGESLAQYNLTDASTFFSAAATRAGASRAVLPQDAGTLVFSAGSTLNALGNVLSAPGSGGLGATIEISTSDLMVEGSSTPSATGATLSAPVVQSWSPGELVLGGELSSGSSGLSLDVTAQRVTFAPGVSLSANEILTVASQDIDIQSGAKLASTSAVSGTAPSQQPSQTSITLTGAGADGAALLALSDLQLPIAARPAQSGGSTLATIEVESGATLSSRGAIAIDSPGVVTVAGTVAGRGAAWSFSSNSIAFVGNGAASSDTFKIDSALLAQMQDAGALRIASAGAIDLLSPVTLGVDGAGTAPAMGNLTLIGSALNNDSVDGGRFGAKTLVLEGNGLSAAAPVAGSGTLNLIANELDLGPGTLTVDGFADTNAQVSGAIVGEGAGGLIIGGNVSLSAAALTAMGGSAASVSAPTGNLQFVGTKSSAPLSVPLGGQISLLAENLTIDGTIDVRGGNAQLQASGNIALGSAAVVNAAGTLVTIGNQVAGAAGGDVIINAGGNLSLPAGARIDVSGAGSAPAGALSLTGGGTLTLGATLLGSAAPTAIGGSLAVDAGTLSGGLGALTPALNSGGFSDSISVRVHTGDLDQAAGSAITANVISLSADSGSVDIAGALSARSAGLRGSIGLFGGQGVTLESGAALHADGAGTNGQGGAIELSTSGGALTLDGGSVISTAGAAQNGKLLLQAPAINGTDVAITGIGSNLQAVGQVTVEPIEVFPVSAAPTSSDLATIYNTVATYMTAAGPAIAARLALPSTDAPLIVEPAVELQSTGALNLAGPIDLSTWRFAQGEPAAVVASGGAPVDFVVRAGGPITISGSVSDGISGLGSSAPNLIGGLSSTMRFVSGADLSGANPLAVVAGSSADLTLAAGTVVTTGTGDIDLVASGNVIFGGPGASAYTTGIPVVPAGVSVNVGSGQRIFNFPTAGGNVDVDAGIDVIGVPVAESIAQWQIRQGNSSHDAQWGADLTQFGWNLGTLGGGDLSVRAGRDIVNLSAAAADSYIAAGNSPNGVATEYGSGGLTVTAGRDVQTGQFFVASGVGTLTAGDAFGMSPGTRPVGSLIALENSQVSLWARDDIDLAAVLNPTDLPQLSTSAPINGQYYTYSESSALSLQSTAGTANIDNDPIAAEALVGAPTSIGISQYFQAMASLPASLRMVALTGDVAAPSSSNHLGAVYLFPSQIGQLTLLAGQDIIGNSAGSATLAMSDAFSSAVPTAQDPGNAGTIFIGAAGDLHSGDSTPATITAGRDIVGLSLTVPKQARIEAGRDIADLSFSGQNLHPGDMTLVSAGRDLSWSSSVDDGGIQLGGPGSLVMLAGRNVDLGISSGVTTIGNIDNPNLPTTAGAGATILAGLGTAPDYSGFLSSIIEPSAQYQQSLVSYVESVTGQSGLSASQADKEFKAFDTNQQRPLIDNVFFTALNASGLQANAQPSIGFAQGYAAIDALFPDSRTATRPAGVADPYSGDLTLVFSRIYTLEGGGISLLAPGGLVNVGLANPPASLAARPPSDLGIVAQGAGDINIYSKGDVLVSQSRLFTLGGGNILIWSDEGNIDAGNGAKSSLSVPPPQLLVSATGNVTLNLTGAVAGSGIRTIQIDPSVPAGNVDLIAPEGTVNAGDAGIGAAGNINIAAVQVIGASNINFGGSATGVPAQVSNIGATAASASTAASSATTAATATATSAENKEAAAPLAEAAISWLDVFVTGLGEDNCRPDDTECLKRQQQQK